MCLGNASVPGLFFIGKGGKRPWCGAPSFALITHGPLLDGRGMILKPH